MSGWVGLAFDTDCNTQRVGFRPILPCLCQSDGKAIPICPAWGQSWTSDARPRSGVAQPKAKFPQFSETSRLARRARSPEVEALRVQARAMVRFARSARSALRVTISAGRLLPRHRHAGRSLPLGVALKQAFGSNNRPAWREWPDGWSVHRNPGIDEGFLDGALFRLLPTAACPKWEWAG